MKIKGKSEHQLLKALKRYSESGSKKAGYIERYLKGKKWRPNFYYPQEVKNDPLKENL